ncbi:hypothetical protein CEXT_493111 [Caerostris extrusa]|uniref:Uncharacterized protein n=1 Tax=Caerostris extrusa TaxID=172846 RepID=A0AAV4S3H2_CAEEX|nr:hypothetical protein CEXT_493111 [Caerostris extrusa]
MLMNVADSLDWILESYSAEHPTEISFKGSLRYYLGALLNSVKSENQLICLLKPEFGLSANFLRTIQLERKS